MVLQKVQIFKLESLHWKHTLAQDVDRDNHSNYETDEVSNDFFISDKPIFDDVYNFGLPNITRSYEDTIQDSLENDEFVRGEAHNLFL